MPLTEAAIRAAKPQAGKREYYLQDGDGLLLAIRETGAKRWILRYYIDGKEKRAGLGSYPEIGLADARNLKHEFKRELSLGVNPQERKKAEQETAAREKAIKAMTFERVAREWHGLKIAPSKSAQYSRDTMTRLERYIFPHIGTRPINEVTAPEILTPLRAIEAQGKNELCHTMRQISGQIFRYGIAAGVCERDPAADLRGALAPVVVKHRAALTDPRQVKDLIRAMTAFSGSAVVKSALWFSAYTFQRPGEIRHAEWGEISLDEAIWRIPDIKMKEREAHTVPLSLQAVKILQSLKPLTGHGKYIFPNNRNTVRGDAPMSENTITAALRRLGFGQDEMCAHGFRGMASTILNEQGWPPDVIERALAHAEGNSVRAAYNHARHLPQRREMMQAWADWLDNLRND